MSVLTSVEEQKLQEQKEEHKQTLIKFTYDFKTSFLIWIKISGIVALVAVLVYLISKFIFRWDILYETDLPISSIFLAAFFMFVFSVIACWLVAFFLYNTKHRRNTKYKTLDVRRGGARNG